MSVWSIIQNMSFHALWNFGVLFLVLLSIVLFLFLIPKHPQFTNKHGISFILGGLFLFVAMGSPLNLLGRILFRFHMVQMIVLFLFAAPLIVYGLKGTHLVNYRIRSIYPVALFVSVFYVYHLPPIFDIVRTQYRLNYVSLLILFLTMLYGWAPFYLWGEKIHVRYFVFLFPMCLFLIFSQENLYSIYTDSSLLKNAILLCLPQGVSYTELSEDLIIASLPINPIIEQKIAGGVLLVVLLFFFVFSKLSVVQVKRFR